MIAKVCVVLAVVCVALAVASPVDIKPTMPVVKPGMMTPTMGKPMGRSHLVYSAPAYYGEYYEAPAYEPYYGVPTYDDYYADYYNRYYNYYNSYPYASSYYAF